MAVIVIILVLAFLFMREMANGRYVGTGGTLLVVLVIAVLIIVGVKSCSSNDKPSKSTPSTYSNSYSNTYVCRRSGCGKEPLYTDWNRRYCSEHINETSYCRHPECMNPVPHTSTSPYCAEHR